MAYSGYNSGIPYGALQAPGMIIWAEPGVIPNSPTKGPNILICHEHWDADSVEL